MLHAATNALLSGSEHFTEALKGYQRVALELDPSNGDAYAGWGWSLMIRETLPLLARCPARYDGRTLARITQSLSACTNSLTAISNSGVDPFIA